MAYDPTIHHRSSIRLPGYNYAQAGGYFVTLVTKEREDLFGEVREGAMELSQIGEILRDCWLAIPTHIENVTLDEYIIMPNHLHGIIMIHDRRGEASRRSDRDASPLLPAGTTPGSLGAIIQNFKSVSTRKINQFRHSPGTAVWQRNYYEHILRNERELTAIQRYIRNNPIQWSRDQENIRSGERS